MRKEVDDLPKGERDGGVKVFLGKVKENPGKSAMILAFVVAVVVLAVL